MLQSRLGERTDKVVHYSKRSWQKPEKRSLKEQLDKQSSSEQ